MVVEPNESESNAAIKRVDVREEIDDISNPNRLIQVSDLSDNREAGKVIGSSAEIFSSTGVNDPIPNTYIPADRQAIRRERQRSGRSPFDQRDASAVSLTADTRKYLVIRKPRESYNDENENRTKRAPYQGTSIDANDYENQTHLNPSSLIEKRANVFQILNNQ
jgi:hypothetical protein